MSRSKFLWWLSGGVNYGLLQDVVTANTGQQLSARINYNGVITGNYYKGVYNSATTYNEGERVSNNASGYFWWQALGTLTGGAHPHAPDIFADNASWRRLYSWEVLQDLDDGTYIRYSMGFNQDDFIRWHKIQRGTLSQTAISTTNGSIEFGTAIGASTSGVVVGVVPQSLSYTIPTVLTNVFDKISVGSSSSSMTILGSGASPSFVNITLATGQSLSVGDALKLENTTSIFNIARVISYNSSTGAAYLAIINGVGSGTYTSWTCYKVALVFASWNGAPTFVYVHGLVDTYNSGTGAITITTFVQLGNSGTTRTNWTFTQGRQAPVGTSGANTSVSQSSASLGQMVKGVYKNNSFVWNADQINSGTGWRIIITEGPSAGNEYTIDTYNAVFASNQSFVVANDLAPSTSAGYGFIAFSITSPSGSSTNTNAGVRHSTNTANPQSFTYRSYVDVFTQTIPIAGQGDSSGELAWRFKRDGTADTDYWLPDHNFDRVSFENEEPVFSVDGLVIAKDDIITSEMAYRFQPITSIKITQDIDVRHPDEAGSAGTMITEHTLDNLGLYYNLQIIPVWGWAISTGYEHMISFPESGGNRWFNTMTTDTQEVFTWPGGTSPVNLTSDQIGWQSALFESTQSSYTGNQEIQLALWVDSRTFWRIGESGKGQDTVGYSAGPKLYPRPFDTYVLSVPRTIEGRLKAGIY